MRLRVGLVVALLGYPSNKNCKPAYPRLPKCADRSRWTSLVNVASIFFPVWWPEATNPDRYEIAAGVGMVGSGGRSISG